MFLQSPDRLANLLPQLYAILAFPVAVFLVFATPPFQVADEGNHFLRATQIASGRLIAEKFGDAGAGGEIDAEAVYASTAFDDLKFEPRNKLDPGLYAEVAALRWGEMAKEQASFPNTAIYPPFFYLPVALGVRLGKIGGLSILQTLYLARLINAIAGVALAVLALAFCARGRSAMFVVLCFPMVLGLFGSASPDTLSIASGAFAVAVWSRFLGRDRDMPPALRCAVALLLGCIVAARLPLLPLYGLLALPTSSARRLFSRNRLSRADLIAIGLGLLPIAFGIVGAHAAKIPFRVNDGVSPTGQLAFLLHDPARIVGVAAATLEDFGLRYLHEMVGVLGWLDTPMPPAYYPWTGFWLALAVATEWLAGGGAFSGPSRWLHLCLVTLASASVFAALYLAWTPVGAPVVDGVQGRYLIVPVLFLLAALPGRPGRPAAPSPVLPWVRLLVCTAAGVSALWVVPTTILARYYG